MGLFDMSLNQCNVENSRIVQESNKHKLNPRNFQILNL